MASIWWGRHASAGGSTCAGNSFNCSASPCPLKTSTVFNRAPVQLNAQTPTELWPDQEDRRTYKCYLNSLGKWAITLGLKLKDPYIIPELSSGSLRCAARIRYIVELVEVALQYLGRFCESK